MLVEQGFMLDNGADFEYCLDFAVEHGFDFVEVNMIHQFARNHTSAEEVREAINERKLGLVAHLPYRLNTGSPRESVREGNLEELQLAIDAAVSYGGEKGVYHLKTGIHNAKWDDSLSMTNLFDTAEQLAEYGRKRGLEPLGENIKAGIFDMTDLPKLFAETNVNACLDTGHAYAGGANAGAQARLIREHGDRISHIHLNDSRMESTDEHLPVGMGVIDFEKITKAMRESNWSGTCTHELYTYDYSYAAMSKNKFTHLLKKSE